MNTAAAQCATFYKVLLFPGSISKNLEAITVDFCAETIKISTKCAI
jgi:hypothetical protein